MVAESAVVDLFCGAGGLTHGFVLEGFNVVAGVDVDESCRYAFEKNNHSRFIHKDIQRVTGEESFLNNFPHGCTLDLLGGECQDPSRGDVGIWLYRFVDCEANRSWIPWAGALSSHEAGPLDYWVEIKCQILTMMMR